MNKLNVNLAFLKNCWISIFLLISLHNLECVGQSSEKVLIADSSMNHPDIESILELPYFENKVVFVDFWYTSCSPCLQEFPFTPDLKNRFKEQELSFLYICVPTTAKWSIKNEKTWRELIEKHKLEGIHVKVTDAFAENFWESHKDSISEDLLYAYPTYLLINKQGEIVNFRAPRPSKKEILYQQIDKLLIED